MSLAENLRSLVFFLAYPGPGNLDGASRSLIDTKYLLEALDEVLADSDFGAIEVTSLKVPTLRKEVAKRLKASDKKIAFHCEPVQWTNEEGLIDPADLSCPSEVQRRRAVDRILKLMDEAQEYGAEHIFVASGTNPASGMPYDASSDQVEERAFRALCQSLRTLCEQAKKRKLKLGISVCDGGSSGPGVYRRQLIGSTDRALQLAETLQSEGYDSFGLGLGTGHLTLAGEGPEAIAKLAPYLQWFYFSNCVPELGDVQPRFGHPQGKIGAAELSQYMTALAEVDFEGPLAIAVKPSGSEVPANVVQVAFSLVEEAANSLDVAYALPLGYSFRSRDFLIEEVFAEMTELRVQQPNLAREELNKRKKRDVLAPDGRLVVLAADHPARSVTNVGSNATAMGHRLDYLGRILRVLVASEVDGLMATSDLIDEIAIANYIIKKRGGKGFLDNMVLIGSMNRTGLAGTEHELMDRASSYMTGKRIKEMNLDGGKLLWRWVPTGEPKDRYALETMERVAKCVEELADVGLPAFVEPLPVIKTEKGFKTDMSTDNIIKAVGVASGLGYYTGHVWLKIPYCADFARVAKSSTFPILLLGGESTGRPSGTIENFVRGMGAGPNIRGALVGRNVLFCGDDDPAAIAQAINLVVHNRSSAIEAIDSARKIRGSKKDIFS